MPDATDPPATTLSGHRGRPAPFFLVPGHRARLAPLLLAALCLPGCDAAPAASAADGRPAVRFTRVLSGALLADTSSSPSASWFDVDGDGDEDLYVLNGYGSLEAEPVPQADVLYRNDGGGVFTPLPDHPLVQDAAFSGSATWGDYDNDGDADVFVANQQGVDNVLFRNEGGGSFVRVTQGPVVSDGGRSFSATWVDVDGDGWLDLHVLNGRDGATGEEDFAYRNRGDGTFERMDAAFVADTLPSGGAAWGDYDGDGDADVFLPVAAVSVDNRLYRNDGGWAFTEVSAEVGLGFEPLPGSPRGAVAHWIDLDADGDLDLWVGTVGTMDLLYENDGAGRFGRTTAGRVGLDMTYVSDAVWADLDNDADLDLVLAVWGGASEIYLNEGGALRRVEAGELDDVVTFASSVSTSDVDADGDLDLYLTQWPINEAGGAPNLLYRNDSNGGAWVRIALEGTTSNRSGVGAEIVVTAEVDGAVRRQKRIVTARTSWRSANGPVRHFGLADAGRIDRIEVLWPSGRVDDVPGPVEVNRTLTIVEGEGLLSSASAGGHPPARPDARR